MKLETAPVLALVGGLVAVGGVAYGVVVPAPKTKAAETAAMLMNAVVFATGVSVAGLIVWGLKK